MVFSMDWIFHHVQFKCLWNKVSLSHEFFENRGHKIPNMLLISLLISLIFPSASLSVLSKHISDFYHLSVLQPNAQENVLTILNTIKKTSEIHLTNGSETFKRMKTIQVLCRPIFRQTQKSRGKVKLKLTDLKCSNLSFGKETTNFHKWILNFWGPDLAPEVSWSVWANSTYV